MAIYSKTNLKALYDTTFADNTTEEISEGDLRQFKDDVIDSIGYWQGAWDWSTNSNALPTAWPVGGYGYSSSDRYTIGNPNYAPARSRILRIGPGATEADFIIN